MHRLLWPLLGGLLASQAAALDIGAMTLAMAPKQEFITRTLTNNSASPKLYDIQMEKISDPTARGRTLPTVPGELLFAPKRFTLHSRQAQNVKFYYKGPTDDHERYYRITFTESPAAQVDDGGHTQHWGTVEVKLALQSILVVRPRQSRFEYQLDSAQSSITNTGNTYFEFMVKQGCEQPDSEADSKYLLPGETYQNPRIGQAGNQKLIVYQSRFIPVGKDCWPD
ncbi:fimbria/pilus periplasmic chaperone [Aeromonas media]|uniref:Fimbria/pilus periplasmic chaperone n=1 Tax=Aeromonas media TaxID=651 RepID=A0AAP6G838_AERME|nr:fimbria/pilus periplasmic chaperone [Aeromonas media]MDX7920992.1 fimbria/pilus periplasmic chaperone [Aeromonas media]